jgi:hypothetical protein
LRNFFDRRLPLIDGFPEALEHMVGHPLVKLHQDVVFIFEIQIDGSIRDTGLLGDLGDGGLMKTPVRRKP